MPRITKISQNGLELISTFEGLRLKAYQDSGGIWTIGVGTTRYPNGQRVKQGDTCTKQQALDWLQYDVKSASKDVDDLTRDDINQNQFDALCSFVYNCGRGAYQGSTMRKLINLNLADPQIAKEFVRWNKVQGKVVNGLTNRRKAESALYFS